ncbi:MAG: hypothetical protein ACRYFX_25300 [Janthinobacterium lividum]
MAESAPEVVAPAPAAKGIELKDAITTALVGLAALLPGKIMPAVAGMCAPFLSVGITSLVGEWWQERLADRKASAPTRRSERYLQQMEKQLRNLPPTAPERPQLAAHIQQLRERLHEHRMSELVVVPPTPPADPEA